MALVKKVQSIIVMAQAIQEMGMFSRPAEYEKLIKDHLVPVLLDIAQFVDDFEFAEDGEHPEIVSVADVLNEFQEKQKASDAVIAELKQEITTLKGRVTKLQKSTPAVAA